MPSITVSVVSHGHGAPVMQLLCKIDALCTAHVGRVVLTINVPEPALAAQVRARVWGFALTLVHNPQPQGFGANHNAAFRHNALDYFCVLNPDIDFDADPFADLRLKLAAPQAGCSFPVQVDADGRLQDFARSVPSPAALLERYSPFGRAGATSRAGAAPPVQSPIQPDWVNGACMLFRAGVFKQLGGFDERYFMYCEDVDICLRLQLAGFALSGASVHVTHAAQRNSRANVRHLVWHVASLLRLWASAPYRQFVRHR